MTINILAIGTVQTQNTCSALIFILILALLVAIVFIVKLKKRIKILERANIPHSPNFDDNSKLIRDLQDENQTKVRFLSIIAHDLKNPISSIKMLADVFLQDSKTSGNQHFEELSQALKLSVDSLYKLLESLLTWSRSQLGTIKCDPKEVSVAILANNVKDSVNSVCEAKKISLKISQIGSETIFCDENMLETVLRNLITNAVKFSYPNSCINLNFSSNTLFSIVTVSDDGVGMNHEIVQRLFKLDQVVSTSGTCHESGSGLGLILCNDFIKKHNGTIDVFSEEGLGTTITIKLPLKK